MRSIIDAETGAHLWADQFDADRTNILQMQDEIVTRLARTLEVQLWQVDASRVARTRPGNSSAEDLALRCLSYTFTNVPAQGDYSLCDRALQIDPRNALALALISWKIIGPVLDGQSTDPETDTRRADELVTQAIAVDPNLYIAHYRKAWVLLSQTRPEEAVIEAERSLALNPSFIDAYTPQCLANDVLGRPERALELADKAIRLSPRDPKLPILHWQKAVAYSVMQKNEQAIEWMRRTLAVWPKWALGNLMFAGTLALNGNEVEARETLRRYLSFNDANMRTISLVSRQLPRYSDNPIWEAYVKRLQEGLRHAGMPED
jgi:tetratricopeptide (TPR) repeat protein